MNRTQPVSYAVISPVKNEAQYISQTLESMIAQTLQPKVWIVVDDASTDSTATIVQGYAVKHSWIRYLFHPGEARRNTGSAEIHAFDYGLKALTGNVLRGELDTDFEFIAKLDGDLRFGAQYFESLLAEFMDDETLGIASGIYLEADEHTWKAIAMPGYHAAGASKVLRRKCFEQIGGFIAQRGWDTIDEIRARAKGWETRHFPSITFFHLRKEGAGMGQMRTAAMHGEIFYRSGGGSLFFMLKSLHRALFGKPFALAGAAMLYGYFRSLLKRQSMLVSRLEAKTYRRLLNHRLRDLMPKAT
jgi:poly-beta-1,6-N-acetyl-D-glucosamine synthase